MTNETLNERGLPESIFLKYILIVKHKNKLSHPRGMQFFYVTSCLIYDRISEIRGKKLRDGCRVTYASIVVYFKE